MIEKIIESAVYGVILLVIIEILRKNSGKLKKYKDAFFDSPTFPAFSFDFLEEKGRGW